jgi:2-iminobutanoate/2-iminopropanoate deaminase
MLTRQRIVTEHAPKPIGPYSVGIGTEGFVFASGMLGLDPATGELAPGGIEAETRQSLTNLSSILQAGGSSLRNVVKTTVYLREMSDFARMNAVYAEFFPEEPPARTTIQAAGLPKGGAIEIEAIAVRGG